MSWSINIYIRQRDRLMLTEPPFNLPAPIQDVIIPAIEAASKRDDTIFHVEGSGHQATGKDHNITTVNLRVEPITVVGMV
jgi:hypothetical protein